MGADPFEGRDPGGGGSSTAPSHGVTTNVLESMTDPFVLLDGDWRFTFANGRALEFLGRSRETVLGQSLWDVLPQARGSAFESELRRAMRGEAAMEVETLSPHSDRIVAARAYPFASGLSLHLRDVTDRRRIEARDSFLLQLADATRRLGDPDSMTETAARLLGRRLGVSRCAYAHAVDRQSFDVAGDYCDGVRSMVGRHEWAAVGLELQRAALAGEPFVVEDVQTDPRLAAVRDGYAEAGIAAMIVMPILNGTDLVAGLTVHQSTPRSWTGDEVELVSAVASRCWESIERARLTRTLLHKTRALSLLADNGMRLLSEEQPDILIDSLFEQAIELVGADVCFHFALMPGGQRLRLESACGVDPSLRSSLRFMNLDDSICGAVVRNGAPMVLSSVQVGTDPLSALARDAGLGAYACYPLVAAGEVLGTLSFGTRRHDAFDPNDLEFLRAMAAQVAAGYGRTRAAAALRESEERLLQAAVIAGLGTFEILVATNDVLMNDLGLAMYGWTAGSPVPFARLQRHFHPQDRGPVIAAVQAAIERRAPAGFEFEHRIIRADGATRWVRVRGQAIFDPADGPDARAARVLGTYVDVTDRKEADERSERTLQAERLARAEAERVARMKDEFLATVSHELRTPLNAILGWSQLLRRKEMEPEEIARAIATINRNARAQAQLIDDLLDMSRIVSGRIRLERQPVDIARIAATAVESIQPSAAALGIAVRFESKTSDATIFGDAVRLQQVAWNILSNAVKFSGRGGEVAVTLEAGNGGFRLTVADTGIGISPDFLPYIFEPFRQEDGSTTRRHGGVGLGLSIAKQLIELHGGAISVASGGAGQGTTFVVSMPGGIPWQEELIPTDRRRPAIHDSSDSSGSATPPLLGVRVMVVEDEPDSRELVRRVLQRAGAVVIAAEGPADALRRLPGSGVDVLVSDIGMPEMDGCELIRAVRSSPELDVAAIRAVAISAYARPEDHQRALAAGFQRYLAKPLDVQLLTAAVVEMARPTVDGRRNSG